MAGPAVNRASRLQEPSEAARAEGVYLACLSMGAVTALDATIYETSCIHSRFSPFANPWSEGLATLKQSFQQRMPYRAAL